MKNKLAIFAALCAMTTLFFAAEQVIQAAKFALRLCVELIIPSLFPFFVLSILLNRLGCSQLMSKRLSGAGAAALFVGLTGGYPLGAVYIAGMVERGVIDDAEGSRLLGYCNNSGPAFIIGAVGAGIFNSAAVGLMLYICHIAAALLTGLVLCKKSGVRGGEIKTVEFESFSRAFPAAVKDAVSAVLNVCGFAVCFSVFTALLDANGFLTLMVEGLATVTKMPSEWLRAMFTGMLELSSGIGAMRGFEVSPANLALAAFLLGWGGLSVHFQTMAAIADTNIKGTPHLAGRLLSATFGSALAYFLALVFFRS